ncbi:hypothetical protein QVD17_26016 [Tagetes erecta]|uniref:USP domain-containing protein n=1 Tax=Tagetes erecta TaxID=13708 RepID=A0AAD8NPY3_TARER|nr:hypothetical protein QVD17_26016 [Tagetes erecta]
MYCESVALTLQLIFCKLYYGGTVPDTVDLENCLGWTDVDAFVQRDALDFFKSLCLKLDEQMKGTEVEGCLQKIFLDLQLEIEGCQSIYDSFDKYVVNKGVFFVDLPPVLILKLNRLDSVNINDRYEFPLELDLDRDDRKYVLRDANKSVRNIYSLHSVLVHSDDVCGRHYYSFVRPTLSNQWYKFDENVAKVDSKMALEEQYAGEEGRNSNVYMLVYVRECDKEKIVFNMDGDYIGDHIKSKWRFDKEDTRYRQNMEGFDYFDLTEIEYVKNFFLTSDTPVKIINECVAKEFGVPVEFQRIWLCAKRKHETYRPSRPLISREKKRTIGKLSCTHFKKQEADLVLFLETEIGPDKKLLPPPEITQDDILLFFKFFESEKIIPCYVGRLFVNKHWDVASVIPKLKEMAGFNFDETVELYEELKYEPKVICHPLNIYASFADCLIKSGTIICCQKLHDFVIPYGTGFLQPALKKYRPREGQFYLERSRLHPYDNLLERLAYEFGLEDPSKIMLYTRDNGQYTRIVNDNQVSDLMYYQVLEHLDTNT